MMMLIKRGDLGPAVPLVQDRLRELGYFEGGESGFGPQTEEAVRQFQRSRGLGPDGVVGPITWARLFPLRRFTREYLQGVLYGDGGRQVYDGLDEVVGAVAAGEGGAFDALQLNGDGEGLSFGILQWAQRPGSLQPLLQACYGADEAKFVEIFGDRAPGRPWTCWRKPGAGARSWPCGKAPGPCASGGRAGTWNSNRCSTNWPGGKWRPAWRTGTPFIPRGSSRGAALPCGPW